MKMRMLALFFLLMGLTSVVSHAKEQVTNTPPGRPWLAKADQNGDGAISVDEAQKAEEMWLKNAPGKRDLDNNPPGPKGGPGSDWEKEDKQAAKEAWKLKKEEIKEELKEDREEAKEIRQEKKEEWIEAHPNADPPGPVGGPGAGPRFDNNNNPPGLAGGPGTNWENKPGPQGSPGAGAERINPPGPVGGPGAGASPNKGGGGFAKKKT